MPLRRPKTAGDASDPDRYGPTGILNTSVDSWIAKRQDGTETFRENLPSSAPKTAASLPPLSDPFQARRLSVMTTPARNGRCKVRLPEPAARRLP